MSPRGRRHGAVGDDVTLVAVEAAAHAAAKASEATASNDAAPRHTRADVCESN